MNLPVPCILRLAISWVILCSLDDGSAQYKQQTAKQGLTLESTILTRTIDCLWWAWRTSDATSARREGTSSDWKQQPGGGCAIIQNAPDMDLHAKHRRRSHHPCMLYYVHTVRYEPMAFCEHNSLIPLPNKRRKCVNTGLHLCLRASESRIFCIQETILSRQCYTEDEIETGRLRIYILFH